nr:hypothetical protein [Kibdelosporangium sp. MJ126-NF4]
MDTLSRFTGPIPGEIEVTGDAMPCGEALVASFEELHLFDSGKAHPQHDGVSLADKSEYFDAGPHEAVPQ